MLAGRCMQVATAVKDLAGGPAQRMRVLYEALLGSAGEGDKLAALAGAKAAYLKPHAQVGRRRYLGIAGYRGISVLRRRCSTRLAGHLGASPCKVAWRAWAPPTPPLARLGSPC